MLAGLAFHFWSSVTLARGERPGAAASTPVADGPFRYVRNPIYLAGITLLLGVGLLYSTWRAVDLALPLLLFVYFHLSVVWVEEPALRRQFGSEYEIPASESRGGFLFQCHAHGLPNRTMQLTALHAAGDLSIPETDAFFSKLLVVPHRLHCDAVLSSARSFVSRAPGSARTPT